VVVAASHGVFVRGARERLRDAGVTEILVSDSIIVEPGGEPPVTRVEIAPLLADVVERLMAAGSLRDMH
jgi:phosphoribosylpyrophosphate synthetase